MKFLVQHKRGKAGGRTFTMTMGSGWPTPDHVRLGKAIDKAVQQEFGWDNTATMDEAVIRERIEKVVRGILPEGTEYEIRIRG